MGVRADSLIKNTAILSFGTLCTKGIMFLATPFFTRWLTVSEYGQFDLIMTYVTLLAPLLTLASDEAVFRFVVDEENENKKSTIISTVFVIDIIGLTLLVLGSILFGDLFISDMRVLIAFILYFIFEILYKFAMMSMRGIKKLDVYTIGNIIYVFSLAIVSTVLVYFMNMGLPGLILGYAIGEVVAIVVVVAISRVDKYIRFNFFSLNEMKKILKYSIPMIPNAISWWIVTVSDRTLISIFLGATANAVYAVANKVPALCTTFFSVFHLSWQQSATESMSDRDRDIYYTNIMNNMFSIVSSICILILGINYWFFKLLFIEDYFLGYYQAPILVLSIVFSMLGQFIGGIYVAQLKSLKNGLTTFLAAVINLVVNIILIEKCGLYAASISTLVAYLSLFIIRYIDVRREFNIVFLNKSYLVMFLLIYFFFTSYYDSLILRWTNLGLAILIFIILNRSFVNTVLTRLFKGRFS